MVCSTSCSGLALAEVFWEEIQNLCPAMRRDAAPAAERCCLIEHAGGVGPDNAGLGASDFSNARKGHLADNAWQSLRPSRRNGQGTDRSVVSLVSNG